MKKLLLVLMVVAMASFLLVGCLGEGTVVDEDDDDVIPPPPTVDPYITVVGGYVDSDGVTYLKATGNVIKVTFPEAVDSEYSVYIAKMELDDTTPVYTPTLGILATTTDRLVWTATVDAADLEAVECQPLCLVALVKHPCCVGEEVALKVVTPDLIAPVLAVDLTVANFLDCAGCVTPDPCLPCAVYLNWSSITPASGCDPADDTCEDADACSDVGAWKFVVDKAGCNECVVATGTGCPITVADGCLCFLGSEDDDPIDYELTFDIADNAGNAAATQSWTITVDSGCVVTLGT